MRIVLSNTQYNSKTSIVDIKLRNGVTRRRVVAKTFRDYKSFAIVSYISLY